MQYPCIESTIDISYYPITVRIWINESSFGFIEANFKTVVEDVRDFLDLRGTEDKKAVIEFVSKNVPNINAVQILDSITDSKGAKYGVMVYTVPF